MKPKYYAPTLMPKCLVAKRQLEARNLSPKHTSSTTNSRFQTLSAVCSNSATKLLQKAAKMWFPSIVWLAWAHSLTRGSSTQASESGMALRRIRVLSKLSVKEAASFFETCQANQILQRQHSVPSRVHSKVQKAEEFCERGVGTAVWHPLLNGSLAGFCCPANATWCRGCAEADGNAQACGRCHQPWHASSSQSSV